MRPGTIMNHVQSRQDSLLLAVCVDTLAQEHGRWRVAWAALVAAVRGKNAAKPQSSLCLPNAIRRDIGLPPIVDPPSHWDVRW